MSTSEASTALWNWGAIAVFIALAAGAIRSIQRAFTATDYLDTHFTERQRRARAGLESDVIVPRLANLFAKAGEQLPGWSRSQLTEQELTALMQDELQSADYIDDLRDLGSLARDHDDIDTSYTGAERSARTRGFAGVGVVVFGAYPGYWFASDQENTSPLFWVLIGFALLASTVMVISWVVETRLRHRLVRLCRTYERPVGS
jgi:hypothetical protein